MNKQCNTCTSKSLEYISKYLTVVNSRAFLNFTRRWSELNKVKLISLPRSQAYRRLKKVIFIYYIYMN